MYRKNIFIFLSALLFLVNFNEVYGARTRRFGSTKTYVKKAPYAGYGQKSTVNGKIKTKRASGYFKPSNGYKFVNPYAKSK